MSDPAVDHVVNQLRAMTMPDDAFPLMAKHRERGRNGGYVRILTVRGEHVMDVTEVAVGMAAVDVVNGQPVM